MSATLGVPGGLVEAEGRCSASMQPKLQPNNSPGFLNPLWISFIIQSSSGQLSNSLDIMCGPFENQLLSRFEEQLSHEGNGHDSGMHAATCDRYHALGNSCPLSRFFSGKVWLGSSYLPTSFDIRFDYNASGY
jgi:hypothetical protein